MSKKASITRDARTGQFVVGRQAFAAISAVEGLHMPVEMAADFREMDRRDASPQVRRKVLSGKYGK